MSTPHQKRFKSWLDTFISEKGINTARILEAEGESGTNFIPVGVIIEHCYIANVSEQAMIKNTLVKIDFHNGDVYHFFNHLAQAIAK